VADLVHGDVATDHCEHDPITEALYHSVAELLEADLKPERVPLRVSIARLQLFQELLGP